MAELLEQAESVGTSVRYTAVRALTEQLAAPLSAEDQTVQSMPDTSPTKWHRAHTSWFFETFLLRSLDDNFQPFHPAYEYLFNSYYEGVGAFHPRQSRGLLSRPGIDEIADYRAHVDRQVAELLDGPLDAPVAGMVELGLNHEQQHQELLLMDIKHTLSRNPLHRSYLDLQSPVVGADRLPALTWTDYPGGPVEVGAAGDGFSYDNERPRHLEYLRPFSVADRPVTCGEWVAFIDDGGYRRPELWDQFKEAWDRYLQGEQRSARLRVLAAACAFHSRMFSISPRATPHASSVRSTTKRPPTRSSMRACAIDPSRS